MKKTLYLITLLLLIGCKKEEIIKNEPPKGPLKLDYYTETIRLAGYGDQTKVKVQYEYDPAGKLTKYTNYGYDFSSAAWEEGHHDTFTYEAGRVVKMEEYLAGAGAPFAQDVYEYLPDGRISKITETNTASGVTSVATFSYGSSNESDKVNYTYSNGAASEYEFSYAGQDIQHDKTTQGGELCNEGTYTYDTKVNPFHRLGYTDFALVNYSTNNLLTADVTYVTCSSPTFVQGPHVYEYNDQGYPTVVTTTYKNDDRLTSERRFYYEP